MGNSETKDYIIKDVDTELWKQFKHRLIDDDFTIKDGMTKLIQAYVNGKVKIK